MFQNLNPFRIILALLIVFIPLYPKFPLLGVNGTYVAIRLDDIVIGLTLLFWLIYQLKNRFSIVKNKIFPIFAAYFIAIIISALTAILIYQNISPSIIILNTLRRFEYMSLFFMSIYALKTKKDFFFPYLFLLITMVGIAIYGYGQKYLQFPVISTMNEEFSKGQLLQMNVWTRISSTFAGHYDLAAFLSIILIIISSIAVITTNKWLKISSILIFLIGFDLLTLTASRVSIFAFWGGATLSFILIKKYFWILPVTLLMVFSIFNSKDLNQRLLATIPSLKIQIDKKLNTPTAIPTLVPTLAPIAIVSSAPIKISGRPTTPTPTVIRHPPVDEYLPVDTDVGVARSGEIRFNVEWPRAITAFRKNPLTGTGAGSITLATDNDYLRSLGESGLIGFISFTGIFIYFIVKTIPIIKRKNTTIVDKLPLIFLSVTTTIWANAVFIDIFESSKVAYTIWIIMAIYYQSLVLTNEKKS